MKTTNRRTLSILRIEISRSIRLIEKRRTPASLNEEGIKGVRDAVRDNNKIDVTGEDE